MEGPGGWPWSWVTKGEPWSGAEVTRELWSKALQGAVIETACRSGWKRLERGPNVSGRTSQERAWRCGQQAGDTEAARDTEEVSSPGGGITHAAPGLTGPPGVMRRDQGARFMRRYSGEAGAEY